MLIEFHKKSSNKGANIGINRKFDSPSLIYYRCRRQDLIEVFRAGPVCKFSLVLTFPCLNGWCIWWYWCTRQTFILNQSHKFRMPEEVQVLGMGLSFWSKCLLKTLYKYNVIFGSIFTKLCYLIHVHVQLMIHTTCFYEGRSIDIVTVVTKIKQ